MAFNIRLALLAPWGVPHETGPGGVSLRLQLVSDLQAIPA